MPSSGDLVRSPTAGHHPSSTIPASCSRYNTIDITTLILTACLRKRTCLLTTRVVATFSASAEISRSHHLRELVQIQIQKPTIQICILDYVHAQTSLIGVLLAHRGAAHGSPCSTHCTRCASAYPRERHRTTGYIGYPAHGMFPPSFWQRPKELCSCNYYYWKVAQRNRRAAVHG